MKPRLEIDFTLSQQRSFLFGKCYVPSDSEFLLNNSRTALLLALRSLRLPNGSGVGMLVYNCHTVMNAIDQAGCVPVFIDVKDDLTIDFEDLKKKGNRMKALIVTHLFGIINDVRKIKELYPDLVIIEDCAHAYGIDGIFGDFATFSIGQGKLPSIGDGGMLVVRNNKYMENVRAIFDTLLEYSWIQGIGLFMKLLLKSWLNKGFLYSWLVLPLKQKRSKGAGKELIFPKKMCKGIMAVYCRERNNVSQRIEERMKNAEELRRRLRIMDERCSYVGVNAFMLVVRCQDPDYLRRELRRQGLDSATHFSNALVWAQEFGYHTGECPNVEKIIVQLLMIPTY